jgi:hypothetical protein
MVVESFRWLLDVGEFFSKNPDSGVNDMTDVTTDIEHWYGMNEPEDQQDEDDLIQSIETITAVGNYATEQRNGQLFVSGWGTERLRLAGDTAKARLLDYVRNAKVFDETEPDFQRAIEDSNS